MALRADEPLDFAATSARSSRRIASSATARMTARGRQDLRLDTAAGLREKLEDRSSVSPGDPAASELYLRITHADPDQRMPPADSKKSLTPQQIDTIRRWIAAGGAYSEHWSLRPLAAPLVPQVSCPEWRENPIDAFVLARLERDGIEPSPEAERFRLIRRVTLDLTGLPPTPEEIDAFLADASPDAYEQARGPAARLPRYGERMAWDWLDAARYADTNGYQGDDERTMWPWRDWVVDAFNRQPAVRPVHRLATRRRPAAGRDARAEYSPPASTAIT